MGSRYTSKKSNEWFRITMLKLNIKCLGQTFSITKIDRSTLSRYINQKRRSSIETICAVLEITGGELLVVFGVKDYHPDTK